MIIEIGNAALTTTAKRNKDNVKVFSFKLETESQSITLDIKDPELLPLLVHELQMFVRFKEMERKDAAK